MFPTNPFLLSSVIVAASYLVFQIVSRTSILCIFRKWWRLVEDGCYIYQNYKVPQFNEHMQENQLYRKVCTYLNSLPVVEDSDFANLFSGTKSNDINLVLDENQPVVDTFLGARVYWKNEPNNGSRSRSRSLVLRIRRNDKRRILKNYLQHILAVFDEIDARKKEVRLYINAEPEPDRNGRWKSVPFNHPATIETVAMDSDLKSKVRSDLESFAKSKQYYHRLGRVWKRSYLLYGPSGTGKSSFVAGISKLLSYDVYDVDLSKISSDSDLKMLMLQTTSKSVIVIEDLDRYLESKSANVSLSGILNFMDGLISCCGEERLMIFTMNCKDQIDPAVLRPGRIDVHVHFSTCDFSAFKTLASSHLGLKEHKLFSQVEEIFQTGASLTPAEIGEIMISNRTSPSRALKTVITALQSNGGGRRLSESSSGRVAEDPGESGSFFAREGAKEFRKLYGLLRLRSSRKESLDLDSLEKENSRPENC